MTRADKVRWLSRYQEINRQYNIVFESYVTYKLKLTSLSAQIITDMPIAHRARDKMSDSLAALEGLEGKTLAVLQQLQIIRLQVVSSIDSIKSIKSKTILRYRYICGFSWGEIRTRTGLTRMGIYKMHVKALDNLKI